jgi:DNA-binding response OmpR family regulator
VHGDIYSCPRVPNDARMGVQMSLITRSGIRKRQTVLIADDEPNLRVLVHTTIESPMYQVIEACDGEEAWILIKERRPALVLLDMKMPRRSGLEVLTAIRADPELRGTQVMVLTASDQQADIDAGILAGADYYLTKPFSPADLLARVSEAIGQRVPSW